MFTSTDVLSKVKFRWVLSVIGVRWIYNNYLLSIVFTLSRSLQLDTVKYGSHSDGKSL